MQQLALTVQSKKSLQNTKHTNNFMSNAYQKSLMSLSDVNKLMRREQTYKKKFKSLVQTNALAQAKIKIFQSSIKDQRSTLIFQLNELSKTLNSRISAYIDQKLDRDRLANNQMAQQTIKQMINKFQQVQKQIKVNKNVYENLNSIYQHYVSYSQEIQKLVQMTQKTNKEYQESMKNMLQEKHSQIMNKKSHNQDISDQTQLCIQKIEDYDQGRINLINQQKQLQKYLEKLLKIQAETRNQVQRFNSWAKIVIDKNHRKMFHKQNKQKENELRKITQKNNNLEVYLHQLQIQESKLKQQLLQKENQKNKKQKAQPKKINKSKSRTKKQAFNTIKV